VKIRIAVIWDMTPSSLVASY